MKVSVVVIVQCLLLIACCFFNDTQGASPGGSQNNKGGTRQPSGGSRGRSGGTRKGGKGGGLKKSAPQLPPGSRNSKPALSPDELARVQSRMEGLSAQGSGSKRAGGGTADGNGKRGGGGNGGGGNGRSGGGGNGGGANGRSGGGGNGGSANGRRGDDGNGRKGGGGSTILRPAPSGAQGNARLLSGVDRAKAKAGLDKTAGLLGSGSALPGRAAEGTSGTNSQMRHLMRGGGDGGGSLGPGGGSNRAYIAEGINSLVPSRGSADYGLDSGTGSTWSRVPNGGSTNFRPVSSDGLVDSADYTYVEWTEWGPCNATCGVGYQARTKHRLEGTAEWKRCVAMECDETYLDPYSAEVEEPCEDPSPFAVIFGMLMGIMLTVGAVGIYFLVIRIMDRKKEKDADARGPFPKIDRGPLPAIPGENRKRKASKTTAIQNKRKASMKKASKRASTKNVKIKLIESDTDDFDEDENTSDDDDDENPYLDPSEINPPGSDYEIDLLGEPPAPPSKHYFDDDGTYESPKLQRGEPDYMEFE